MSQLEDLLQQCTVKLTLGGSQGTGFFVAPEWILTCAHVVKGAEGRPIRVRWQSQENWAEAVVERSLPDPYDLALLSIKLPPEANPPCIYLDAASQSRDPLYLFGYPDKDFPNGCPVTFSCEGLTGDEPALIKFALGQVRPGMSGSPLLNQRTGKVCGMVKFTRDRSIDLGGGAIPTRVILEQFPQLREFQREFHQGDRRWHNLLPTTTASDKALDAKIVEPYLRSLIMNERYQQKWGFYTSTDAIGKLQEPKATSELDVELMVQLMQPKKMEDDQNSEREKQEKAERLPVLEGIQKYAAEHVLLMGRPGSGKSTALLRLLVEDAQKALADPSARIPVLVELRYMDVELPSMLERIEAFLRSHDLVLEETTLKTALGDGQLLLLVDGVNELPSEAARREVTRFRQDFPKTLMVFTTRDVALGGDLGIKKKLEMQPLSEVQMRQFVQTYLPEQGEPMLQQLQGRLKEVGQTPLLLWMLCQVFQASKQLPSSLGLLFRWFVGEYDKLKQDAPVSEGLHHWQSELLQHLAFMMMQAEEPTELRVAIPRSEAETILAEFLIDKVDYPIQRAKEWLEDLLEHHLIQPTSQNQLEFHHQLLQDYYAAEALLRRLPHLSDEQLQQDYLNYLKWTEPISLMLTLLDQPVQAMRMVSLALDIDLMLGARFAGEVQPTLQPQAMVLIGDQDIPRWLKCRLFGKTHSDYAVEPLVDAFSDADWFVRRNVVEALGEISTEKAIISLLKGFEDEEPEIIYETSEMLRKLAPKSLIPDLIRAMNKLDDYARGKAEFIIEKLLDTTDALEELKPLIESDEAIKNYIENYHRLNDFFASLNAPTVITQEQLDQPHKTSEINREFNIEEITLLVEIITDSSFKKRLMDSPDWRRRDQVLKNLNYKFAYKKLEASINSPNQEIRESSFQFTEAAICLIDKVIKDSDWRVREQAVLLADEIVTCMHKLQEELGLDERVKRILEKATLILLSLIKDPSEYVRAKVIGTLGAISAESALISFREALQDPDFSVRTYAARVLGDMRDEQAIPPLLGLLNDEVLDIKAAAAYALSKISQKTLLLVEHLPYLSNLIIEDLGKDVQQLVSTIQSRCKFYNYEIWREAIQNQEQANLVEQTTPPSPTHLLAKIDQTTQQIDRRTQQMVNEPKNNFGGATFNAPVNSGDNPTGDFIGTQNNYAADPEVQGAIADLQTLLTQLQSQHPQVTTETEALTILDAEFTEIKQSKTHRLATLRKQLLNPKRHLQATKAALGEIAKHYLEESVWAKTLLTYLDKLSEDPNHGA